MKSAAKRATIERELELLASAFDRARAAAEAEGLDPAGTDRFVAGYVEAAIRASVTEIRAALADKPRGKRRP